MVNEVVGGWGPRALGVGVGEVEAGLALRHLECVVYLDHVEGLEVREVLEVAHLRSIK